MNRADTSKFKSEIENADFEILMGYLRVLYNGQTTDEQVGGQVVHKNHMGFNRFDASRMTKIIKGYDRGRGVYHDDVAYLRKKLPKYHAQLKQHRVIPMPVTDETDHGTAKEHVETKDIPHNEHSHEMVKIKLLIPYSESVIGGIHYILKRGDVAEIPQRRAYSLISPGFATKVDGVTLS